MSMSRSSSSLLTGAHRKFEYHKAKIKAVELPNGPLETWRASGNNSRNSEVLICSIREAGLYGFPKNAHLFSSIHCRRFKISEQNLRA